MSLILLAAATTSLLTVVSLRFVFERLTSRGQALPLEEDWQWLPFQPVSAERYGPMERLLTEEDFDYIAAHPGFDRKRLSRFRSQRREIFRRYLVYLSRDYSRLCAAIRMLMVQSAQDRPDLAALLLKQRANFTLGLLAAEFNLMLHALGIGPLRARHLIETSESLSLELKQLAGQTGESGLPALELAQNC